MISALIAVLALSSTTGATTYAANLLDGVVEVSELVPQPDPSLSNGVAVLDAVKDLPDIATLLEILADNATVATLLSPSNKALADLLDDLGMTSANELVAHTLCKPLSWSKQQAPPGRLPPPPRHRGRGDPGERDC